MHMSSFDMPKLNLEYYEKDQQKYKIDKNKCFKFTNAVFNKTVFIDKYVKHYYIHFNYQLNNVLYCYISQDKQLIYF